MAFADMQYLFLSGELIVANGPFCFQKTGFDILCKSIGDNFYEFEMSNLFFGKNKLRQAGHYTPVASYNRLLHNSVLLR